MFTDLSAHLPRGNSIWPVSGEELRRWLKQEDGWYTPLTKVQVESEHNRYRHCEKQQRRWSAGQKIKPAEIDW